jgi:hypothetical protein
VSPQSEPVLAGACCEMSRRDGAIVALHEVPGAPPQECRPVGYGLILAGVRTDSMIIGHEPRLKKHGAHFDPKIPLGLATPDHTVPYGTDLSRDAFPGTSCQATISVVPTGRAGKHFATASNLAQLFGERVTYLSMIAVKRLLRSLTNTAYELFPVPLRTGASSTVPTASMPRIGGNLTSGE